MEKLLWLVKYLINENPKYKDRIEIPTDENELFNLYRSLVNVRMPEPISEEYLSVEDEFLQGEICKKGIAHISELIPCDDNIYLWQGDITTIDADAIVNAANSQLLGCFCPCHTCIDNCIHTFSGVRLRLKCNEIMQKQGHNEPTGEAKITPAYNLPSKYVIHTVGPIIHGEVTQNDKDLLKSCYTECLKLADEYKLKSIAFCCISTGEFHFPNDPAAEIAIKTVKDFKRYTNSKIKVVFNVLKIWTTKSTENFSDNIIRLKNEIDTADAIVIGAGAGLSVSAGFDYAGERFERYFSDFHNKYGITDMYSGGFYPFETLEEYWVWWSRHILVNRYDCPVGKPYRDLLELVKDKDYFVLTTNVDHQFQKAGFDKKRLFYTQGDYGLWQCSKPCHDKTYDNEEAVRAMAEQQKDMKIPTALIPKCPVCGAPMTMNLRCDNAFVQDEGWYKAANRYSDFIRSHNNSHILYFELGVGMNTPVIIKYPFWQMTKNNPNAVYACINQEQAFCPQDIRQQAICINEDIGDTLSSI